MITGHLKKDSPLRSIWPDGIVPLTRRDTVSATLGDAPLPERVYLLDVYQLTPEQREKVAARLVEMGQGTIEEARAHLATVEEFPIREVHIANRAIPLRSLL